MSSPRARRIALATVVAIAISICVGIFATTHKMAIANIVSFLGLLALSYPTLRINEQGRKIARVNRLQTQITNQVKSLESGDVADERQQQEEKSLNDSNKRLTDAKSELEAAKGSWTVVVEVCLIGGYLMLFGGSIIRIFPDQ